MPSPISSSGRFALVVALFWLPAVALAQDKVEVVIAGVKGDLLNNVRAYLSLDQPREKPFLTEERVRQLFAQAPQEIEKALQALGYYHPQVRSDLSRKGDTWVARFDIDPGPPVRIGAINLKITGEGEKDKAFSDFRLPFKQGDVLNQGQYENTKRALQELAAERGYLDAGFTESQIRLSLRRSRYRAAFPHRPPLPVGPGHLPATGGL
jgi:translocation and assembly module TamA